MAVESWDVAANKHNIPTMLRLQEADYVRVTAELIGSVTEEIRACITWLKAQDGVEEVGFRDKLALFHEDYTRSLERIVPGEAGIRDSTATELGSQVGGGTSWRTEV